MRAKCRAFLNRRATPMTGIFHRISSYRRGTSRGKERESPVVGYFDFRKVLAKKTPPTKAPMAIRSIANSIRATGTPINTYATLSALRCS